MAVILPFPADQRLGKVRRVAAVYRRKTTAKAKTSYWNSILDAMEHDLRRVGFDDFMVNMQLTSFARAVELELLRSDGCGSPTGAA